MTAIASRRRRRTWYALAAGLLVVATIPVLAIAGWRAIRDSRAAQDVTTRPPTVPLTPTALLAGTDADGALTMLAMLALAPGGAGGSIVDIPVGSSVTGEDGVRHRLADRYAAGGVEQLQQDVESVMLVNLDLVEVVDAARLASLLEPVGDLTVDLPADVVQGGPAVPGSGADDAGADEGRDDGRAGDGDDQDDRDDADRQGSDGDGPDSADDDAGTDAEGDADARPRSTPTSGGTTTTAVAGEVVAPAGRQELTPEAAAQVLLAASAGESETARLPVHEAVWGAVAAAVGSGRPGVSPVEVSPGSPADVETLVGALWAGSVRPWQMAATPITSPDENPDGADLLLLDLAEVIMVVATSAPSAASAVLDGATVQLTSGFADWHVTRDAIAVLAYVGGNVMVVVNTDEEPPATTEVYVGSPAAQALAEEYAEALAAGPVQPVTDPVEGIEVQIVLGRSFEASQRPDATPLESVPSRETIDQNLVTTTEGQADDGQADETAASPEPSADDATTATVES